MFNICFENNLFVEFFYYKNTVFAHGKGYKLRHEIEFFLCVQPDPQSCYNLWWTRTDRKKIGENWNVNEYLLLGWSESHI